MIIITILSAVVLIIAAYNVGQLFLGWGASNFWMAPVRMIFPFFCGLLLFRLGDSARFNLKAAYPLLTLLLLGVFMMPQFKESSLNGLYEAAAVIVIFPLIVAIGAGSSIRSETTKKLCDFFGRISYPIYITHYPFIYIYTHWVSAEQPDAAQSLAVAAGLLVWFIVLAYVAVRYYDEPVRAWLRRSYE